MFRSTLFPVLALLSLVSAGSDLSARDLTPVIAEANATIYTGVHGYTYQGCYNETTGISNSAGLRALSDGNMVCEFSPRGTRLSRSRSSSRSLLLTPIFFSPSPKTSNATTTAESCINYCRHNDMAYAGLEYGQECWCAPYLSGLSAKLNESVCDLACVGNTSEICGGRLALTLYHSTTSGSGASFLRRGDGGLLYAVGAGILGSVVLLVL